MAHKPKIDQNCAPSKVTLGGIPPQAVTHRQIELESCSNPLKQRFPTFFAARTPLSGQSILSTPQKNFEIYIAL